MRLQLNVPGVTHKSGHTLDWVIDKAERSKVRKCHVLDKALSDHHAVYFDVSLSINREAKTVIRCRNLKRIDLETLKADFGALGLQSAVPVDVSAHAELFESSVQNILDKHAPEVTKRVSLRPLCLWYNDEVYLAKE